MTIKDFSSKISVSKKFGYDYLVELKDVNKLNDLYNTLKNIGTYVIPYGTKGYRLTSKKSKDFITQYIYENTNLEKKDYTVLSTLEFNSLRM
ncbi:hypothetical protein [Companilactobacillus sp. HBUAS56275]|uniref:Uncharacterized protein n=1 Tax=Candidatus Companilactobacillus pullicola TaxID=2838523 RepID=A0A9D1ZN64_9LACO|nr:hypothetical protein [Candidatus Companilactobacillus pullicola]